MRLLQTSPMVPGWAGWSCSCSQYELPIVPTTLVFWVLLTPIPERQSLQCRKHSFPHPSVHQTDRYYYYCYCSSRGWNIFKHLVFKNIFFYNNICNFPQTHKFLQWNILLNIVVCYIVFWKLVLIGPLCMQQHICLQWFCLTFVSMFQKSCFKICFRVSHRPRLNQNITCFKNNSFYNELWA